MEHAGSCWAFSAAASIEGINKIVKGDLISLSEQQLFACDNNDDGCAGGLHYRAFSYVVSIGGITTTAYEIVPANNEKLLMNAVANQPVCGIFDEPCGTNLNHEVTLVGYDTADDGGPYWIAKNSWGESWGEEGYILLKKDVPEKEGQCGLAIRAAFPVI
ncbi:hypothetical protein MUK42_17965 [Musa troglodytarum]|uniref:Peptidase C1A papain C-terminal domain-containing protein n=1 Tax=Musa troglodytarum TaxID=320322 RepID=A0A9E7HAK2_9LILI|nr:hypothetical protein MUK42_17965 [Musa troglodytarum]